MIDEPDNDDITSTDPMDQVQPGVAEALGMAIPDMENQPEEDILSQNMVVVEPHEIITVENSDLPDMTDIAVKGAEGEKQLEELIVRGLVAFKSAFDEVAKTEPKYRGRMLEVSGALYGQVLEAIKHKNELQLKKAKARMDQANFTLKKATPAPDASGNPRTVTNNNIILNGDREALRKFIESQMNSPQT